MTKGKVISKTVYKDDKPVKNRKWIFSRKQLCIPYGLFLFMFVIFPLLLIVFYAFTDETGKISFYNFIDFFTNPTSITNLFMSIGLAGITTVCCLLIGYPVAYILSKMKQRVAGVIVMLFVLPMWINFVLRAMAMKELLTLIGMFGKNNFLNTVIGMVYDYLPFMIMPLYTTLIKRDRSLEEAAADLGSNRRQVFTKVIFPLSLPGVLSGINMVFLPTMSCYVVSDTFGNGKVTIIGKLIEEQFGVAANWNYGSALALIMLVIMFVTMLLTGGFKPQENMRGANL
ncbi:MAG: ABC transporter permease [Clostridia bacterium]|nr:ABC transporter permease [Clostridia bacterium]